MKFNTQKAFSLIEIGFALFALFFIYVFVLKQIIVDIHFSALRENATNAYEQLESASQQILNSTGYENVFRNEYDIIKIFSKNINIKKNCINAKNDGCWSENWLWNEVSKPGIQLKSGQFVVAELSSATCSSNINIKGTCGALYVDINGKDEPNMIGQDIIKIYITNNGLVPAGIKSDIINPPKSCNMINKFTWGCSARLLSK